ncbi:MAG TPA: hypothetical protein VII23_01070, partial [Terriglobales bacterium]
RGGGFRMDSAAGAFAGGRSGGKRLGKCGKRQEAEESRYQQPRATHFAFHESVLCRRFKSNNDATSAIHFMIAINV